MLHSQEYSIRAYTYGILFLDTTEIEAYRKFNKALTDNNIPVILNGVDQMIQEADYESYSRSDYHRALTEVTKMGKFDLDETYQTAQIRKESFFISLEFLEKNYLKLKAGKKLSIEEMDPLKNKYLQRTMSIFKNESVWVPGMEFYTNCIDFDELENKYSCDRFHDFDLEHERGNHSFYGIALKQEAMKELLDRMENQDQNHHCYNQFQRQFLIQSLKEMLKENRMMVLVYSG